jgi:hypothetical protein
MTPAQARTSGAPGSAALQRDPPGPGKAAGHAGFAATDTTFGCTMRA